MISYVLNQNTSKNKVHSKLKERQRKRVGFIVNKSQYWCKPGFSEESE